jgi:hypothetical protein
MPSDRTAARALSYSGTKGFLGFAWLRRPLALGVFHARSAINDVDSNGGQQFG